MKQIFIIHGGDSFSSYEAYRENLENKQIDYERMRPKKQWKTWLAEQMPEADVLLPSLPNDSNAVFDEWAIYFEKLMSFFGDDVRLVGHSLGAMFLAKYLQKNPTKKKMRQLILIAGGYDDDTNGDYGSFKVESVTNLPQSAEEIHLFHSKDDSVVSFTELAKFRSDLPDATAHIFEDRFHFIDETFPELLEILQKD